MDTKELGATPDAAALQPTPRGPRGCGLTGSGSLRIVLLVAVQLLRIVGGHVGKILEDVLVGFIPCQRESKRETPATR